MKEDNELIWLKALKTTNSKTRASARFYSFILLAVGFIALCRFDRKIADFYAETLYPFISDFLSLISSPFSFSLEEITLLVIFLGAVIKSIYHKGLSIILVWIKAVALCFCWIYIGWAINYFRSPINEREEKVEYSKFDENKFTEFVKEYINNLNDSYTETEVPFDKLENNIKEIYLSVSPKFGLHKPRSWHHPKKQIFQDLYSKVGVLGYMGPFFAESQLNKDLTQKEIPFTYAHEYSHLLGVSSEAEANFWAYTVCIKSDFLPIRYSGYLGILNYILQNCRLTLSDKEYKTLVASIRPEIIKDYTDIYNHWQSLYSPLLGKIQNDVYDAFLKGNKIASGVKNYSEVVSIIINYKNYPIFE